MLDVYDHEEAIKNVPYRLKCKVTIKPIAYDDIQSNGITKKTEEMAFLTPDEGTERDKFFTAWMPQEEDFVELVAEVAHPINGVIRCSLHKTDKRMPHPYIFVMTKSAEEALKANNGKSIFITVLPQGEEIRGDKQKDFALAGNKNAGTYVSEKGIQL